jgi:hypothetical protein
MLGTRDNPLPIGGAKGSPERDRLAGLVSDELQPVLVDLFQRYPQPAVIQGLMSWTATLLVRGLGPERAAKVLTDAAAAAPTMAAIDETRQAGQSAGRA